MVEAMQGFSTADRKAKGKRGGTAAVVFIMAVVPAARGGGAFDVIPSELDITSVINGIVVGKPPKTFSTSLMCQKKRLISTWLSESHSHWRLSLDLSHFAWKI